MIFQIILTVLGIVALVGGLVYALTDGYGNRKYFAVIDGELYWLRGRNGKQN